MQEIASQQKSASKFAAAVLRSCSLHVYVCVIEEVQELCAMVASIDTTRISSNDIAML